MDIWTKSKEEQSEEEEQSDLKNEERFEAARFEEETRSNLKNEEKIWRGTRKNEDLPSKEEQFDLKGRFEEAIWSEEEERRSTVEERRRRTKKEEWSNIEEEEVKLECLKLDFHKSTLKDLIFILELKF